MTAAPFRMENFVLEESAQHVFVKMVEIEDADLVLFDGGG